MRRTGGPDLPTSRPVLGFRGLCGPALASPAHDGVRSPPYPRAAAPRHGWTRRAGRSCSSARASAPTQRRPWQVDSNGTFAYSPVRAVTLDDKPNDLTLVPNPTQATTRPRPGPAWRCSTRWTDACSRSRPTRADRAGAARRLTTRRARGAQRPPRRAPRGRIASAEATLPSRQGQACPKSPGFDMAIQDVARVRIWR